MAVRWPRGLDGRLCYGGDYNPEQWPEPVWAEDVALMREAGVNLVSVGVFSWALLEPAEGEFDFGWLDRVLDLLDAGGVRAALATPTASPPPWFSLAHPDALPVTREGVRLTHGSRDTYCASAPAYRQACRRLVGSLAGRYASHPALAMWHVHNEYGTWCYCDHTAAAFRRWLRARHGDLARLNEAWTTSFWGQHYTDWAQVLPPRATQYLPNPAQSLDFRRFLSDELLDSFREQRELLRAAAPEVPVTTNFVLGAWAPVAHWSWASEVDLVAIDHYPEGVETAEQETAFAADLARAWAGGGSWLLMEQAPNLVYAGGRMLAKAPGLMARLTLSHVARGSRGAMFFQWRAPRGGAEAFHSAMVPHAGPDTRVFREVVELGAVLPAIAQADAGRVEAEVAILWDDEAGWALETAGLPSPDLSYGYAVRAVHGALWRAGITVDFARPGADVSAYRLVLVPSLYPVTDETAAMLRSYVEQGGSLGVWFFSGIADEHLRVRLGGHPGAFRDVLGVRVEEFHPLAAGESVPLSTGERGLRWSEQVHTAGAEVLVRYDAGAGVLTGLAAVTRHRYGAGHAWYVSTGLDGDALSQLLGEMVAHAGAGPAVTGTGPGVEVVRRRTGGATWLFALNHTGTEQELPARGETAHRHHSGRHPPPSAGRIRRGAGVLGHPRTCGGNASAPHVRRSAGARSLPGSTVAYGLVQLKLVGNAVVPLGRLACKPHVVD